MRREGDQVVTQLKGSAWFYNELVREPGEPVPETTTNKDGRVPRPLQLRPALARRDARRGVARQLPPRFPLL